MNTEEELEITYGCPICGTALLSTRLERHLGIHQHGQVLRLLAGYIMEAQDEVKA